MYCTVIPKCLKHAVDHPREETWHQNRILNADPQEKVAALEHYQSF
jgi:hypothetical protein